MRGGGRLMDRRRLTVWRGDRDPRLFSNTGVDPTSLGSQTYNSCWVSLAARKVERGGSDRSSEVPGIKHSKLADFEGFRAFSKDNSSRNRPKLFDFGGFRAFSKDNSSRNPPKLFNFGGFRAFSNSRNPPKLFDFGGYVAQDAWQEAEAAQSDRGERERAGQRWSDTVRSWFQVLTPPRTWEDTTPNMSTC